MAPEILFNPGLIYGKDETKGFHEMAHQSIQESDIDMRKELYANIVLSGGSSLFKGLPERF